MRPYYQDDFCVIYHGDCRDVSVKCDMVLADPPYGKAYESGRASGRWGKIRGDDGDVRWVEKAMAHVLTGLRRGRHVYIFGPLDVSSLPLCGITELIWDKTVIGMGDLKLPWGPRHERITFAVYEISKANRDKGYGKLSARLRKGSVLRAIRPHSGRVMYHPTEKPVDVLQQMIESSSVLGETVYDPFMGSGSTLIAAKLEGRKSIGVESEERYCETAAVRVRKCVAASEGE